MGWLNLSNRCPPPIVGGLFILGACYTGPDAAGAETDGATDSSAATEGSAETENGGSGDSGGPGSDAEPSCGTLPTVISRPMRRLTPRQYQNTMRDLLGDAEFDAPYDDVEAIITEDGVREFRAGAELALEHVERWSPDLVPCDIRGAADASCAPAVLDTFAARAFRRPLSEQERTWLLDIYSDAESDGGFQSGMEALLGSILQAPAFVYVIETGTPLEADPSYLALDGYALASRLSYFLWDTMPDDALFDAAASGALATPDGIQAEVARMLSDARSQDKLADVSQSWFHLDGTQEKPGLFDIDKDADLFPEFSFSLAFEMQREFDALIERTLFERGDFAALFSSRDAYVNASLAELYGVPGPVDDSWQWVELDEDQRAGVLTRAAFLSTYASSDVQSPIRRGVFVFENLLCGELGDPPPNASDVPVDGTTPDGGQVTVREEVELVTGGADCSGCHVIINNIGFTFEHYDALGRWQETELVSGLDIETSGALFGSDVDGPLDDAVDLSQRLAQSERLQSCFAERWFTEALGSALDESESCSMDQAVERFAKNGNVHDLLAAIASSDTFRFIKLEAGGE